MEGSILKRHRGVPALHNTVDIDVTEIAEFMPEQKIKGEWSMFKNKKEDIIEDETTVMVKFLDVQVIKGKKNKKGKYASIKDPKEELFPLSLIIEVIPEDFSVIIQYNGARAISKVNKKSMDAILKAKKELEEGKEVLDD